MENKNSNKNVEPMKYKMTKKDFRRKIKGILIWTAIIAILIGTYLLMSYLKENMDWGITEEVSRWNSISWL